MTRLYTERERKRERKRERERGRERGIARYREVSYVITFIRGSFKKYVDFYHNFFSRRHLTLRFGTHIQTTNSVHLQEKFFNLT